MIKFTCPSKNPSMSVQFNVLGSLSIWNSEYLFSFFQLCLPEQNNNKHSIFKIINEVPRTQNVNKKIRLLKKPDQ